MRGIGFPISFIVGVTSVPLLVGSILHPPYFGILVAEWCLVLSWDNLITPGVIGIAFWLYVRSYGSIAAARSVHIERV